MRPVVLTSVTALVFGLCLYLQAERDEAQTIKVQIRLVDENGKNVGGIVRLFPAGKDTPLPLTELFDRLRGLQRPGPFTPGWHVVPAGGAETTLPRAALRLEAISGLESLTAKQDIDLTKGGKEIVVKLRMLFRPAEHNLAAGNTHLHLRNLTKQQADDYLKQVPAADGLRVMFISYLERFKDDQHYITNGYPVGPLKGFEATGVLFNNGEEHRHNFGGYGQGYGHVMFLDINQLVKPVSLGPGITGAGDDDRGLRNGIDDARKQGGTIIWCHNRSGAEDVPSALTGRLHALNVFDGTRTGTYEENYYRYLNIGLRLPLSTGTDWFLYDFSRVYARIKGELTVKSWLAALRAGRCQSTNGPLLSLKVDGLEPGDVLNLDKGKKVRIEATALGRHDFQKLELVHNGKVIQSQAAEAKDGGFSAKLNPEVRIDEPGWFAVRIEAKTTNELGQRLFAHSSPVYIDVAGKRVFDLNAAEALLRQLEQGQQDIRTRGKFSSDPARDALLAIHTEAIGNLKDRINRRGQ
jgi:hypothetical protein